MACRRVTVQRYRVTVKCSSLLEQEQEFSTQGGFNNCGLEPEFSLCCDEVVSIRREREQLKQLSIHVACLLFEIWYVVPG